MLTVPQAKRVHGGIWPSNLAPKLAHRYRDSHTPLCAHNKTRRPLHKAAKIDRCNLCVHVCLGICLAHAYTHLFQRCNWKHDTDSGSSVQNMSTHTHIYITTYRKRSCGLIVSVPVRQTLTHTPRYTRSHTDKHRDADQCAPGCLVRH